MRYELSATYENVMLRSLEEGEIEFLRQWRNDPRNTTFLRKLPHITKEMQEEWYSEYLKDETCYTFAIMEKEVIGGVVGSVCLYDIDKEKRQCEWGRFMIGSEQAHGKGIGLKALLLCLHIGFKFFEMERIYASVHEHNLPARKVDDRAGFVIFGSHPFNDGNNELEIEITKERFYQLHPQMEQVKVEELLKEGK